MSWHDDVTAVDCPLCIAELSKTAERDDHDRPCTCRPAFDIGDIRAPEPTCPAHGSYYEPFSIDT